MSSLLWFLLLIVSKPFGVLSQSGIHPSLHLCCQINIKRTRSNLESLDCEQEIRENPEVSNTRLSPYVWTAPPGVLYPTQNTSVTFRLLYRNMTCTTGQRTITTRTNPPPLQNTSIFNNGHYFQDQKDYYHKNEFCLNKFDSDAIEINVCQPNCPTSKTTSSQNYILNTSVISVTSADEQRTTSCIRKCCGANLSLKYTVLPGMNPKFACYPQDVNFALTTYSDKDKRLSKSKQEQIDFHFLRGRPPCDQGSRLQFYALDLKVAKANNIAHLCFRVHKDGRGFFKNEKRQWEAVSDYCIDAVSNFFRNESTRSSNAYEDELGITMCSRIPQNSSTVGKVDARRKLYGGMMISASIFFLLTFIVYALLWDQRGLHGWTTMGHSASMFFMYLFVGTAHILPATEGEAVLKTFSCVITGVLAHFFFLSSFCWLTLICFDLWFTFRSFNPKSSRSKGLKRFGYYVTFGWGVPTAVIITSLVLDSYAHDLQCGNLVFPSYGERACYVAEEVLGEYVYYPIAALLILNLVLFSITTWKIYEYKQSTRMATSNMENNQQFFKLCIKLFFVMGFSWIFEVISWAHVGTALPWYWTILDCVNMFQAFAIFVIYVCKKETVLALDKKYTCLKPMLRPIMKLFKWRQNAVDVDQSSTLNSTSQRSHERTRDSALSGDSVRMSTTYVPNPKT